MKTLYILKLGSTWPETVARFGDFEHWLQRGLSGFSLPVQVIDVPAQTDLSAALPTLAQSAGLIVTGSHAMVTDKLPWSVFLEEWIPGVVRAQVPFLGVCYGHQLLAEAMGGKVHYHPRGREIGTVPVQITPHAEADELFSGLPEQFSAQATHAQSVKTLPPDAVHLAGNDYEMHHAFRVGSCAWGVQFHPEYCTDIMSTYITMQAERLAAAGQDVGALLAQVQDTPVAASLLQRFARLVEQRSV